LTESNHRFKLLLLNELMELPSEWCGASNLNEEVIVGARKRSRAFPAAGAAESRAALFAAQVGAWVPSRRA
jgi:hypothetical protein